MSRVADPSLAATRRPWEGRQVRTRVEWSTQIPARSVGTVTRYDPNCDVFFVTFDGRETYVWPELLELVEPIENEGPS